MAVPFEQDQLLAHVAQIRRTKRTLLHYREIQEGKRMTGTPRFTRPYVVPFLAHHDFLEHFDCDSGLRSDLSLRTEGRQLWIRYLVPRQTHLEAHNLIQIPSRWTLERRGGLNTASVVVPTISRWRGPYFPVRC